MTKFARHNERAAKLEVHQVKAMREKYAQGATQASLSREYSVSVVQVGRIVRGESWQSLPTVKSAAEMQLEAFSMEARAQESARRVAEMLRIEPVNPEEFIDKPPIPIFNPVPLSKAIADKAKGYGARVVDQFEVETSPKETADAIPKA